MRQNSLRLHSLDRRAAAPAPIHDCGGGEARASGESTEGEFGEDVWVRSGGITPFSCGVLVGSVSVPTSSVGLISWGWTKSALGVEKYYSAVSMS